MVDFGEVKNSPNRHCLNLRTTNDVVLWPELNSQLVMLVRLVPELYMSSRVETSHHSSLQAVVVSKLFSLLVICLVLCNCSTVGGDDRAVSPEFCTLFEATNVLARLV